MYRYRHSGGTTPAVGCSGSQWSEFHIAPPGGSQVKNTKPGLSVLTVKETLKWLTAIRTRKASHRAAIRRADRACSRSLTKSARWLQSTFVPLRCHELRERARHSVGGRDAAHHPSHSGQHAEVPTLSGFDCKASERHHIHDSEGPPMVANQVVLGSGRSVAGNLVKSRLAF